MEKIRDEDWHIIRCNLMCRCWDKGNCMYCKVIKYMKELKEQLEKDDKL